MRKNGLIIIVTVAVTLLLLRYLSSPEGIEATFSNKNLLFIFLTLYVIVLSISLYHNYRKRTLSIVLGLSSLAVIAFLYVIDIQIAIIQALLFLMYSISIIEAAYHSER